MPTKNQVRISNQVAYDKLDKLSKDTGMSKSKLASMIITNYIDAFTELYKKNLQDSAEPATTHGESSDDIKELLKSIDKQVMMDRIDSLINQRMLGSIYQHLILLMQQLPNLPNFSFDVKNKYDKILPSNFSELKEVLLNKSIKAKKEGDEPK